LRKINDRENPPLPRAQRVSLPDSWPLWNLLFHLTWLRLYAATVACASRGSIVPTLLPSSRNRFRYGNIRCAANGRVARRRAARSCHPRRQRRAGYRPSPPAGLIPGQIFLPLTVDDQKSLRRGRFPADLFKRECRPSEKETLTSLLIYRRPQSGRCAPTLLQRSAGIATVMSFIAEVRSRRSRSDRRSGGNRALRHSFMDRSARARVGYVRRHTVL